MALSAVKTKELKVLNNNIDIDVLKYSSLFDIIMYIVDIKPDAEYLVFVVDIVLNEEVFFDAIEEHQSLEGDYTALQTEIMTNKFKEISYWIGEELDRKVKTLGYDDIKSCRSYTGFESSFKEECIILSVWASDCWDKAFLMQDEIIQGIRDFPDKASVLADMPVCSIADGPY